IATVRVENVVTGGVEPTRRHAPDHPLADAEGYIWEAGVDHAAELIEMVETSRQYQNNVQVLQTAKTLTLDTLRLGQ
ncbi:MAG: flagellar basal body rod protein FlgC, partial [Allosphingosinicella sp.]